MFNKGVMHIPALAMAFERIASVRPKPLQFRVYHPLRGLSMIHERFFQV